MKRIIYYVYVMTLTVITTTSCKDDNEVTGVDVKPDFLLRRIGYNGTPRYEFIYDTEGRLIRLYHSGFFSEGYTQYEYNKQGTIESRKYVASNEKLEDRISFKLDDQSRIVEIEDHTAQSDFEEVGARSTFDYDASGRLASKLYRIPGQPATYLEEYTFDAANRLIQMQRTSHPDEAGEYVIFRDEFTPGSIPVYSHWNNLVLLLSASQAEGSIWEMFSLAIQRTTWDDDGEIVASKRTETYDHEFNADGYLIRQNLSIEYLTSPGAPTILEMTYEYTDNL